VKQLDLFGQPQTLREQWAEAEKRPKLNSSVPPQDVPRLTAALQRLLDHMRAGGWHTGPELIPVAGLRYGARLEELKRAGIPFEREHVSEGVWRYRLIHNPATAPESSNSRQY
jgi:hypothetical protein